MKKTVAITHIPSPLMENCELTFVDRQAIDYDRALEQHRGYCAALRSAGIEVVTLDINRNLPDCVFVEDTAIVLDELAVLCSMGAASRRAEPAGIEPELGKYRTVKRIGLPATIDGGDVTLAGRTLLVGNSSRTNRAGIEALRDLVVPYGYNARAIDLRDCLHLKSACTALPDGALLINPQWIHEDALANFELVRIPPNEPWAADVLSIGERVFVAAGNDRTAQIIASRGFAVVTIELGEFAKAEGGATCLSLIIP
jgi:dimethylargininase